MNNPHDPKSLLVGDIQGFASRMRKDNIDERMAARLEQVATIIQQEPSHLLQKDLYQAINPERLVESARSIYLKRSQGAFDVSVLILGFLSCLLIIFNLVTFLGGLVAYLNYNQVVGLDAALITLILFFVIWFNWSQRRQLELASQKAVKLVAELEDLLWRIQDILDEERQSDSADPEKRSLVILQSIQNFINNFQEHNRELERLIESEQKRLSQLADSRQGEVENMSSFSSDLKEYSQVMVESVSQFSHALKDFQVAASEFAKETSQMLQIQNSLLGIAQQFKTNAGDLERVIANLVQVQEKTSSALLDATTRNLDKSSELAAVVSDLNKIVRLIGEGQINLQNSLDDQMRSNDNWVKSVQELVQQMQSRT